MTARAIVAYHASSKSLTCQAILNLPQARGFREGAASHKLLLESDVMPFAWRSTYFLRLKRFDHHHHPMLRSNSFRSKHHENTPSLVQIQ